MRRNSSLIIKKQAQPIESSKDAAAPANVIKQPFQHARPDTWENDRWAAAYTQLKAQVKEGMIPRERVVDLLKLANNRHPSAELITSIKEKFLPYALFGPTEAYKMLEAYEDGVRDMWRVEFTKYANVEGLITIAQGYIILRHFKYAPLPDTVADVLTEVNTLHPDPCFAKQRMNFQVFLRLMVLMEEREGFSLKEYEKLKEAFERFDRDGDGQIDSNELSSVTIWLGFTQDVANVRQVVQEAREENYETDKDDGEISFHLFTFFVRKIRLLDYSNTKSMFESFDSNADGIVDLDELLRLCSVLGITVLPEPLLEAVENLSLDPERFSFLCVWKLLQYLRDREGFTTADVDNITEVFKKFDVYNAGELNPRNTYHALRWLGYLLNAKDVQSHAVDWGDLSGNGRLSEVEFRHLVRKHHTKDMQAVRAVYRQYSTNGGALPMRKKSLRRAIKQLNQCYLDDYMAWLRNHLPAKWLFSSDAKLDFEDFRRLIAGCRERVCERLRRHQGFTDMEVARLRIAFVKFANEDGQVGAKGQAGLFKSMVPATEFNADARNRMKKALELAKSVNAEFISWQTFLLIMRKHADLLEDVEERLAPKAIQQIGIPVHLTHEFFDIYNRYTRPGDNVFMLDAGDLALLTTRHAPMDEELLELFEELLLKSSAENRGATPEQFIETLVQLADPKMLKAEVERRELEEMKLKRSGQLRR